jgi:hypothetical protein
MPCPAIMLGAIATSGEARFRSQGRRLLRPAQVLGESITIDRTCKFEALHLDALRPQKVALSGTLSISRSHCFPIRTGKQRRRSHSTAPCDPMNTSGDAPARRSLR